MRPGPPSLSILLLMLSYMTHSTQQDSLPTCPASFSLAYLNPTCSAQPMRPSEGPGPPTGRRTPCHDSQCLSSLADTSLACANPGRFRLAQCREYSLNALDRGLDCEARVRRLQAVDSEVSLLLCSFDEILRRYDCQTSYSVAFDCAHCREAYRRWLCASLLDYYDTQAGGQVKACRSICYAVQQKCPFFLPGDTNFTKANQYAGEPSFVCLDPNIPETGKQMENSMYGESCCYEYCDATSAANSSHFCIRNRTSCQQRKQNAFQCTPVDPVDSGYYYFSSPQAHTSASTSPSPSLLSMFVLVISVPTINNLSSALLPMLASSVLNLFMLKLQLKSILKSLLSLLPPPCLFISRLRLLLVTVLAFVITCFIFILRIAVRTMTYWMSHLFPNFSLLSKSWHIYYDGKLLNVSFKSIVNVFLIIVQTTFFYESISLLFQFSYTFCSKFSRFSTSIIFNTIRCRWGDRTESNSSYGEILLLSKLSRTKQHKSELAFRFTNVESTLLIINKNNIVLVLINLFLILIHFLLEHAVIILLKLRYSLNFNCSIYIKLKTLYEKQFVINLLFTLINLSQHYCFLSGSVSYYYDEHYYILLKIMLRLFSFCRYRNNYQLLFNINNFLVELQICDYAFR